MAQTQVEAERTEVLRLAAELNDLRAAAEQEATAGREKEAALKAMLASETEVCSLATCAPAAGQRFVRCYSMYQIVKQPTTKAGVALAFCPEP